MSQLFKCEHLDVDKMSDDELRKCGVTCTVGDSKTIVKGVVCERCRENMFKVQPISVGHDGENKNEPINQKT